MEQDVNKNNSHLQSLLIVHAIEQCLFTVVKQTQEKMHKIYIFIYKSITLTSLQISKIMSI